MLILTAKRKGLLNDNNTLSLEGKSLIDFLSSDISGEVFVKQKPTATDFDIWWKAYPATDTFTHNGKSFEGSRAMKVRKDDCKEKLTKILSEGEYTIGELVEALQMEVMQKKENSVKTGTNKMSFMQNSLTYLNQRTFEPFIELVKEGVKIKQSSAPTKSVDI